ncbi:THIF-type NAD/FAD binding fold domain-containing protein [[Candida] zeylanoides]
MSPRIVWIVAATAAVTVAAVECVHLFWRPAATGHAAGGSAAPTRPTRYSEELIREQLARNYAFLTEEGMAKVRQQDVVVVGAGGVGSWVATMLVRSGVERIRIIDFDQVSLSSLNRHAVATLADVGTPKVECLRRHLLEVAPWCHIETHNELWNLQSSDRLLGMDASRARPTYVVDCIDNIDTKVDLLEYCVTHKLPVVSSGGAACKSDPTRINIVDLARTEEDPLAKSVRMRLKRRGIASGIPVCFSAEKPDPRKAQLMPLDEAEMARGDVDQLAAMHNFRVRILPVLGTMPGMFGLALASWLLTTVAGYPTEPVEGKNRYKVYDAFLQSLAGQQSRIGERDQRVPVAIHEVRYLLEEVFRGKSPISGFSTRLTFSRWRRDRELSFQNIVVMTKEEQQAHEQRCLIGGEKLEEVYSPEVLAAVERRFAQERYYSQFR